MQTNYTWHTTPTYQYWYRIILRRFSTVHSHFWNRLLCKRWPLQSHLARKQYTTKNFCLARKYKHYKRQTLSSSSCFVFSHQGSPQRIFHYYLSIFCILLRHFNLSHVLFHHIHKPPFWPSPFPLSWQLHPQHLSPHIPIIFPPYMTIPPQSCLSCFLSKPSHLCCPSDVLIPDLVHSCHS